MSKHVSFAWLFTAAIFFGCGGETKPECSLGAEYFQPGCAEPPQQTIDEAGCYAPCNQAGASCDGAGTCREVVINPCPCEPGQTCCDACGETKLLCVP
ncbi:MAG: hypothetical protein IPK82_18900 [Polyangiaceae bacterium]|nr:hypothetical protein [Polyangiaceae bacterium]